MLDVASIYEDLVLIFDELCLTNNRDLDNRYSPISAYNIQFMLSKGIESELKNKWREVNEIESYLKLLDQHLLISLEDEMTVFTGIEDVTLRNYKMNTPVDIARLKQGLK
jgi:hypothetical protein